MTIAHITESYRPTSTRVAHHIELLERAMGAQGHTVRVIAPVAHGVRLRTDSIRYVPSIPFPGASDYQLTFPTLSNAETVLHDADIIHTHHPFAMGSWAQLVAARLGKPLVFTDHADYLSYEQHIPSSTSLKKRPVASFMTQFANASTVVVVPSSDHAARLRASGVHRPLHIIGHAVDTNLFRRGTGAAWRSAVAIPRTALLALHVGSFTDAERIPLLLGALALLDDAYHLVLVGDGPQRSQLERLAETLGVAHRTYFVGQIGYRSMPDVYAGADVLVNARQLEARPTVLLEALAAGIPLLTVPTTISSIQRGTGALIVPASKVGFSSGLRQLHLRPALRHQLRQGTASAVAPHTVDAVTAQTLDTYRLARQLTVPVR